MSEKIYDEQIAPLLQKAGKICEKHGMPFVASVEYEPQQGGTTAFVPPGTSLAIRMAHWSIQSNGNFDWFVIKMRQWAGERPHNSIFMRMIEQKESAK